MGEKVQEIRPKCARCKIKLTQENAHIRADLSACYCTNCVNIISLPDNSQELLDDATSLLTKEQLIQLLKNPELDALSLLSKEQLVQLLKNRNKKTTPTPIKNIPETSSKIKPSVAQSIKVEIPNIDDYIGQTVNGRLIVRKERPNSVLTRCVLCQKDKVVGFRAALDHGCGYCANKTQPGNSKILFESQIKYSSVIAITLREALPTSGESMEICAVEWAKTIGQNEWKRISNGLKFPDPRMVGKVFAYFDKNSEAAKKEHLKFEVIFNQKENKKITDTDTYKAIEDALKDTMTPKAIRAVARDALNAAPGLKIREGVKILKNNGIYYKVTRI